MKTIGSEFSHNGQGNDSLKSITIPNTIISIGDNAFKGCRKLEEVIFEEIKNILPYSNIKHSEIISRLLELLRCRDITIDDIAGTPTEELIQLITEDTGDFKDTKYEIIKEFSCGLYYCVFIRQGEKFILIFEKDNISHVEIFNSFESILRYVIKNILLSEGESIV